MNEKRIEHLEREVASLRAQLEDISRAQTMDRDSAIKAILKVNKDNGQDIAEIYEYLWPVIDKLFPNMRDSLKHAKAALKSGGATSGDKKIH
jgi:hypothetical protein